MKKQILLSLALIIFFSAFLVNAQSTISTPNNNKTTCMYLFYLDGCPHCANVEAYIKTIENNYSLDIKSTNANEYPSLLLNLSQYYNIPKEDYGKVPVIFLGDSYCVGDISCISNLESMIKKYPSGVACVNPNEKKSQISLKEITGLALVNAINPCALAVLILILTTILLRYPDQKKKVLQAGLAFCLAVFISYIALGILIIIGFKSISNIGAASLWIRRVLGSIAIIFGLLNIKDFFFYKQGSFLTEMPLAWRPRMKKLTESITSPKGAFLIGVLITLFLVPCTSAPYFIAGGILSSITNWNVILLWLVYFNLIFVLPALLITFIIYSGLVQAEHVSNWREKNIKRLHLVAGIVMILVGIQIIFGIF